MTDVLVGALQRRAADALARVAGVVGRARVTVIARVLVRRRRASRFRVAHHVEADAGVGALQRRASQTLTGGAGVPGGARVPVVARDAVDGLDQTLARSRLADHRRARAAVVGAGLGAPRRAHAVDARVALRAGGAVFAGAGDGHGQAPGVREALVLGAGVVVVAVQRGAAHADTLGAGVVGGAGVPIVAAGVAPGIRAAGDRVADVDRAGIIVIAVELGRVLPDTHAVVAGVIRGARVPVVAYAAHSAVDAAGLRVAVGVGARVAVLARGRGAADALPGRAGVRGRAGVLVVAARLVRLVDTPGDGVTRVVGADVVVVALEGGSGDADAGTAGVCDGARVPIVARIDVAGVLATQRRDARVIGAERVVIADDRRARLAHASSADVASGAEVAIVAGRPVDGLYHTGPAGRVTGRRRAGAPVIRAALGGARHALAVDAGVVDGARVVVVA